jgi:hypothetical protein
MKDGRGRGWSGQRAVRRSDRTRYIELLTVERAPGHAASAVEPAVLGARENWSMSGGNHVSPDSEATVERQLELAFRPLHKRAFGMAAGLVSALLVFGATVVHMLRTDSAQPLILLAQFFNGYEISVAGAFIGAFWAGIAGFVAGWFFAFCRNFAVALSAFIVRTRAELREVRGFLDHI